MSDWVKPPSMTTIDRFGERSSTITRRSLRLLVLLAFVGTAALIASGSARHERARSVVRSDDGTPISRGSLPVEPPA